MRPLVENILEASRDVVLQFGLPPEGLEALRNRGNAAEEFKRAVDSFREKASRMDEGGKLLGEVDRAAVLAGMAGKHPKSAQS